MTNLVVIDPYKNENVFFKCEFTKDEWDLLGELLISFLKLRATGIVAQLAANNERAISKTG